MTPEVEAALPRRLLLRNHARAFDRSQTGAVGHDAGIEGRQRFWGSRDFPL